MRPSYKERLLLGKQVPGLYTQPKEGREANGHRGSDCRDAGKRHEGRPGETCLAPAGTRLSARTGNSLLDTVYATVLKLTGDVDLAAQVERLVTLERLSL